MKNVFSTLCLTLITLITSLSSQDLAIFTDGSNLLNNNSISGGPFCGFIDLNGDYRDDLIRFSDRDKLYIDIQSNNGEKFVSKSLGRIDGGSWAVLAGDLNNDGVNEILSAGQYNGASILTADNNLSDFSISQVTETTFFAQNANFVDINNDGWLDAFICNDDGLNKIFQNNGAGMLIGNHNLIDMRTEQFSDNSGNYSSVWTDIDDDGDLDFYIGKCRVGIDDATDPRRINMLFINNDGDFVESADQYGLAIGAQTWTANFGDIDNDGDQDVFMVNHGDRSMLFENIENDTFIEIPLLEDSTTLTTEGYQSAFADLNNDGFLDLIITGEEDFLLLNNQQNSFSVNYAPFGIEDLASFALGDANQDGFIDVFGHYNNIFENDFKPANLFINFTNENHYITVATKGDTSNANGIGSKLLIYGDWGVQTRIIKSGTGYGVTNSLTARFGIDEATEIDSLVIHWPSGQKDVYNNPAIDQHYIANEGSCLRPLVTARKSSDVLDCENEEITLSIAANGQTTDWSNGAVGDTSIVTHFDHIFATVTDSLNDFCKTYSQVIVIDTLADLIKPELDIIKGFTLCDNNLPITIGNRGNNELTWSDSTMQVQFEVTQNTNVFASVSNNCDTIYSDVVDAFVYDFANEVFDTTIIIEEVSPVTLTAKYADDVTWINNPIDQVVLAEGNTFNTDSIRSDTTFYYSAVLPQVAPIYVGGESIEQSNTEQSINLDDVNAKIFFKVLDDVIFQGVTVNAIVEGERVFEIFSIEENAIVYKDTFMLQPGFNEVAFDILLIENNYEITTNSNSNVSEFNTLSPQLNTLFTDVSYPYNIGNYIQIQSSILGEEIYPYFFDWRAQILIDSCETELYSINIDLDTINSLVYLSDEEFEIYPNPAHDVININSENIINTMSLFNIEGKKLNHFTVGAQNMQYDLLPLNPGIYIIELASDKGIYRKRIILH